MRAAIIVFAGIFVVTVHAQQTGSNVSAGGRQNVSDQNQLGGCKLRCRKLTFIGEGSVPVKPNWALIDLSVEVNSLQLQGGQDMSGGSNMSGGSSEQQAAKKVREEAQHRSMFILNYLKDFNAQDLKDLEMQEISFKPETEDDKFMGYKATFGLRFKVKIDKFQDVLDHIVSESGANRVDSIVFVPDDEVEQQASIKAIELASSNAWVQAQAVQKVLGIQGTLKLLSVRDKILPVKKLIRRFARRLQDDDGMDMDDLDWNDPQQMLNWLQGDQIVNALLVFQFDFEDGTINFKEPEKVTYNMTVADTFGVLLNKQNQTQPQTTQPQQPQPIETQPVQPVATNATVILPNNTAEMQPIETQPGQPVQPVQPVNTQPPP